MKTHNLVLAEWALARGASPNAEPARDKKLPKHALYELAAIRALRRWPSSWCVTAQRVGSRARRTSDSFRRASGLIAMKHPGC